MQTPFKEYVPASQILHTPPIIENPAGHLQSVIADEFSKDSEYAGQRVGAEEDAGQKVLLGQTCITPPTQKLPETHLLQLPPPTAKKPGIHEHCEIDAAPGSETELAGQAVHCVLLTR